MPEISVPVSRGSTGGVFRRTLRFLSRGLPGSLLLAAFMMLTAAALVWAGRSAWRTQAVLDAPSHIALGVIAAALGATLCLAGAMRFLNVPLLGLPAPRWFVRWPIEIVRRLLMLAELATMAAALWFAVALVFGFKLPTPS